MERGVEGWKVVCLCVNVRSLEHIASALIRVDRGAAVGWMNAAAEEELRTIRGRRSGPDDCGRPIELPINVCKRPFAGQGT
jgi:hypothetical protein